MRRTTTALLAAITIGCVAPSACAGTSSSQVEVRAPEESAPSTTTTAPPDCAELLPAGAQAAQLLMVMVTGPVSATEVLTAGLVGGFGLKGRQSSDVGDEITEATGDVPVTPFVASDEEGGTVQRLGAALGELPSAADLADGTPSEAGQLFSEYARSMVELGFNMNFGPVVDVGSGSDLGSRSFGDDPTTVAGFTDAIVSAQESAGLMSIVKHWPGIGGGGADPHLELASLADIEELRTKDLIPFDRAIQAGASGIMVTHSIVPGLTGADEPASLSRAAITDELRGREGFDGLVITDSLGMGAVVNTTPQDEAAELAITAGADIALLSGTDVVPEAHDRLTDAISSERIPRDQVVASVRRVLAAKGVRGQCLDLVATYSTLLQPDTENATTSTTSGSDSSVVDSGINDTSGSG